jgi:hypothetical protein
MPDRVTRRELLQWAIATGFALPLTDRAVRVATAVAAAAPVKKNVADVLRFSTRPQGWSGSFGFVTFRLHPVFFEGTRAYHIRTDASDQAFARRVGLVHVPKLERAIGVATADYFTFRNGASGQLPVVSTVPGRDDYTPVFRISSVAFTGTPRLLTSVGAVRDAQAGGRVRVVSTRVVVNYPFVRWPEGELPADRAVRAQYLGPGQLLNPPDADRRQVTFKLHQCFPGEWYIVTDTSASPMAPMMRIAPSPRTAPLTKAGATAKILVFGDGIKGPGPMGFQPSIVDSLPGNRVWSPLWDHFTFTWKDGRTPRVVRNQKELLEQEDAGNLRRWPGTPDTNGQVFVVNCPVPVTAPMTWRS